MNEPPSDAETDAAVLRLLAWARRKARQMGLLGVVLVAVVSSVLVTLATTYVANPVEEAEEHVAEPLAQAIGLVDGQCPSGWQAKNARDEHTRIESCSRGGWTVYLHEDGTVSHGCPTTAGVCAGPFVFPNETEFKATGWPE